MKSEDFKGVFMDSMQMKANATLASLSCHFMLIYWTSGVTFD